MFDRLNNNRKLVLHVLFWILYYLLFSLIWVKNGDYQASFYLEFILLPIRVLAVYVTILYLIPQLLLKKKFTNFIIQYLLLLTICGVLQLLFIYFFYDSKSTLPFTNFINFNAFVRAIILINSTVFFVSTIYILHLYFRLKNRQYLDVEVPKIALKSNRRNYMIYSSNIIYIEGLGNYVNYHLENGKKITVYQSLKKTLEDLPENFKRVHKSFILNTNKIVSYNNDVIEVMPNKTIPVGSSFDVQELFKNN